MPLPHCSNRGLAASRDGVRRNGGHYQRCSGESRSADSGDGEQQVRHSFLLACIILACNTATGVNSVIGYNTGILLQSGLSDLLAHWGYVIFTVVNFLSTTIGMVLVDRKGRKFLLVVGTTGIIVIVVSVGLLQDDGKADRGLP